MDELSQISNNKKTVLSADLLLHLYDIFQKVPLPYKYIHVPGIKNFRKWPHVQCFIDGEITYLTLDVMKHCGIYEGKTPNVWNCSWGSPFHINKYCECEPWQKVNHFCGSFLLGRKSELDYRMEELHPLVPDLLDYYPLTFALPRHRQQFDEAISSRRYWIFKVSCSSCGREIYLYDSTTPLSTFPLDLSQFVGVAQEYIERPFLLFGKKFDIRLYAMITSLTPLRIYMNTQGLVRFCPTQYTFDNLDSRSHFTNFSLNKDDPDFVVSNGRKENVNDCKWSLRFFLSFLSLQKKIDVSKLISDFEKIIISTLIASGTAIRICHNPRVKHRKMCYELYGFDIILDENLKSYLLEVNLCPSLSGLSSKLDYDIKYALNLDLFRMANIIDFDLKASKEKQEKLKNDIEQYEERFKTSITPERRTAVEINGLDPWESPVFADFEIVRDLIDELVKKGSTPQESAQISDYFDINEELAISKCQETEKDEEFHGKFPEYGHYRLIFPTPENVQKYSRCFDFKKYEDIVLQNWMLLPEDEKLHIIHSHFMS